MVANFDEKSSVSVTPTRGFNFIEQLQISSLKNCTKLTTPYLTGKNENDKQILLVKSYCKCWSCETCAARSTKKWVAKIINGVNQLGGNWYFFTVTANGSSRGTLSIKALRTGWKLLYNRILSIFEKDASNLYYCKVWEQHKDGTFHLHLLGNFSITKRWLKNNAHKCGLGYQAHVRRVDNAGQIAGYICKYTLKNAAISRGGIIFPAGLRRIETSHKWPKLVKYKGLDDFSWVMNIDRKSQVSQAEFMAAIGYKVIDKVKE